MPARKAETVHIRTSERKNFKRCIQRWWWGSREGLTPKDPSMALWFGTGIHLALAQYYGRKGTRRNMDYIEVWEQFCDEGDPENLHVLPVAEMGEEWVSARALGIEMLRGYHRLYEGDPQWDFIQPEMTFQVRIKLDDGTWIEYDGTFDGVYFDKKDRKFKLLENKTAKSISFKHLSLDPQAGSYWAMAATTLRHQGVLGPRENIAGIEYNFLRKAPPDPRPANANGMRTNKATKLHYSQSKQLQMVLGKSEVRLGMMKIDELEQAANDHKIIVLGEVSKSQPPPLFERTFIKRTVGERRTQIEAIKADAIHMNAVRNGLLPLTKNPTSDCSWDCPFFNMCELHELGNNAWIDFRDAVYVVEDPYKDHRKSA